MYLFIDTIEEGLINLALLDGKGAIKKRLKKTIKKQLSEELLISLDKFLKKNHCNSQKITGIICIKGPGRFTTLRVTLAALNTMAWVLKIPIVGIKRVDFKKPNFYKLIRVVRGKKFRGSILPFYGQEPRITKPKKH